MNKLHLSILAISLVLISGTIITRASNNTESHLTHTVLKGESVSLICIELYGYYSAELGRAFQKDNPDIKNINLISAGQKLKFRKPTPNPPSALELATEASQKDSPSDDTLFVQKVNATQGVVTYVEGVAKLKKATEKQTSTLTVNTIVYNGDQITTGVNGRVELIINRESVVRLKENTIMTVEEFRDNTGGRNRTRLDCGSGTVWTKVKRFKDKICRFELSLPTAIAGVHGTVYQISVNPDNASEVKVYSGEVAVRGKAQELPEGSVVQETSGPQEVSGPSEVSMETWTQVVRSMRRIKIGKDGVPGSPSSFSLNESDKWERWNETRDKRISRIFMETDE